MITPSAGEPARRKPSRAARSGIQDVGPFVTIEAKIHAPVLRPGVVPRPHLVDRLREPGAKLALISAAVGYGKTTLLAEWRAAEEEGRPFAWVTLDAGDDDPVRFWTYLVEGIRRARPEFGESVLTALRTPGIDLAAGALPRLLNELAELPHPVVLALDDYHHIRERRCHELLAAFIERLPPNLTLVLGTRADPPLPLGRLRARGELVELRAADLRFSEEEAAALFAATLETQIDRETVAALAERTEGWPAGLYLAALSLRGRDVREFLRGFTGNQRQVAEYLTGEVLELQDPAVRRFMARTSILERICAPLADAVAGTDNAAAILGEMERSNLFLVPLDEDGKWYRYHHLMAALLGRELERSEPGYTPELHRRANAWHRNHGTVEEAVHHALAAKDWTTAGEMIATHWYPYVNTGRRETVHLWLAAVGDDRIAADPVLALTAAWVAALSGERGDCARWIAIAGRGERSGPIPGGFRSVQSGLALLRAGFGFEGLGTMLEAGRRAVELEADPASPWRAFALLTLGWSLYLWGEGAAAQPYLEEAATVSRSASPVIREIALSVLSLVAVDQGRHEKAERLAREARRIVDEHQLGEAPQSSFAHTALGHALAVQGWLAEASDELDRGLRLRRKDAGLSLWPTVEHLLIYAPVRFALGDHEGAHALLDEARSILVGDPDTHHLRARLKRLETELERQESRQSVLGERLSEAERAVLQLLATNLNRREIGQELFLSLNTVRSHMRAIFRKLGVSSREEAVTRAGSNVG